MRHPSKNIALSFVPIGLLLAGLSACSVTASPTQAPVQVTLPPSKSTSQQQAPQPINTPSLVVFPTTATPAFPTETPTASPPPFEILNEQCFDINGEGGFYFEIIGEVHNNTNVPMSVFIDATVFDSKNQVVGSSTFISPELDAIPPGGKSPFETGGEWTGAAACEVHSQEGFQVDLPRQDITILSSESRVDGNWFHIRGEVQNTGTTPAGSVRVIGTFYGAGGKVVALDAHFTTPDIIPAGGTAPFELDVGGWRNKIDSYELQVQGQDVGNP
jgi:hypothetical protein